MYVPLVLASGIETAYGSRIMVNAARISPETESPLKHKPVAGWTRDDKDAFCVIVSERREADPNGRGIVAHTCKEFGVKPSDYQNWRTRLEKSATTTNGNGHAGNGKAAAAENGHVDTKREPKSVDRATMATLAINAERRALVAKLKTILASADEVAMQLDDRMTDALIMSLTMRMDELEERNGAPRADSTVTPEVSAAETGGDAPDERGPAAPATSIDAEETPMPAETAPENKGETPAAIVTTVRADAALAMTRNPATPVSTTEKPLVNTKPQPTPKELRIQSLEMSLGIAGSHERLTTLAMEQCMSRFNAAYPNAGWLEKKEYEEYAKRMIANFDTEKCGNIIHHVERSFVTSKTRRIDKDRVGDLSRTFLRLAFAMAEEHAKRDDLPRGVTFDRLKSEAYQTFTFLAGIHDPDDTGDFWSWAEPRIQESLDATCGGKAVSYFGAKEKRKVEERQKPVIQTIAERAISRQMSMRKNPDDEARHAAMVSYINGLAEEGRAESIDEVLRVLLQMYMKDIEIAADQAHGEGLRQTIDECMELLVHSTLKSVWLFDTRRRGNLDEYIRNGWTLALRH